MKKSINYFKLVLGLSISSIMALACQKEEGTKELFDNNKINLVVADNFNLSVFNAALRKSGMDKILQNEGGPFTLLSPSDAAFAAAGFGQANAIFETSNAIISPLVQYHTLDGRYELHKLPYLFNQEINSRGGKIYATHWIKGADTVLTLNGSRVLSVNLPASNGLIQVIDRVLTPYVHDFIGDAIASDESITLFAQALKTAGLLEDMRKGGTYTIFAPNNAAMTAFGYHSVQQIEETNPAVLRAFLSYHIVEDRRFIYDYILSTGPSNSTQQGMLDGNTVTITLIPSSTSPGSFSGINLRGPGNVNAVALVKRDALSGNGILHVIDGVLRITQ